MLVWSAITFLCGAMGAVDLCVLSRIASVRLSEVCIGLDWSGCMLSCLCVLIIGEYVGWSGGDICHEASYPSTLRVSY